MPAPLSVGKVVLGAFLVPWWKRRAFARALAIPLAALATLMLSWHYAAESELRFFYWLVGIWLICMVTWWAALTLARTVISNAWRHWPAESSVWMEWSVYICKVPALYVFARLSPILPAAAIDRTIHLKSAWQLTDKNGWRLVLVVGVLPWTVSQLLGLRYRGEATALETAVLTTLGIALSAVGIAALPISYRELMNDEDMQREHPA